MRVILHSRQIWRSSLSAVNSFCRGFSTTVSNQQRLDISGIYPPIATPFNNDESIAFDKLEENFQKWNKLPFRGYVVQGSNGEYAYLNIEERLEMLRRCVDLADKNKLIMAGSGCESTRDTIMMTEKMAKIGAQVVLVVTPCYYKSGMTNTALINHFTKVADASPVPVILYSVPGNTGIDLSPEVIITLSQHPNIAGLKDSGGDISKLGNLVYRTKDNDFQILAGSAGFLYAGYAVGCVGGVCALANVLGRETCDVETLFKSGKHSEARDLQHRLISPNAHITKLYGVPGLKVAMEMFGYYGGPTRSPLQPLTKQEHDKVKQAFTSTGFLK